MKKPCKSVLRYVRDDFDETARIVAGDIAANNLISAPITVNGKTYAMVEHASRNIIIVMEEKHEKA